MNETPMESQADFRNLLTVARWVQGCSKSLPRSTAIDFMVNDYSELIGNILRNTPSAVTTPGENGSDHHLATLYIFTEDQMVNLVQAVRADEREKASGPTLAQILEGVRELLIDHDIEQASPVGIAAHIQVQGDLYRKGVQEYRERNGMPVEITEKLVAVREHALFDSVLFDYHLEPGDILAVHGSLGGDTYRMTTNNRHPSARQALRLLVAHQLIKRREEESRG